MAETTAIVNALKHALKIRGITYVDIAEALSLSESSVKRLFSKNDLTLKRLDQICALAGIEISDLLGIAEEAREKLDQLPQDVEQALVDDSKLLLVAYCVLNYWTFEEILSYYAFEEPELIGMFTKLDRLKLIDLAPGNRTRLLVSAQFQWRRGGPIETFFQRQVQHRFLASHFSRENELRLVLTGMLTATSSADVIDRLKKVAEGFEHTAANDRKAPLDARNSTTLLIAMRPWLFDAFTQFERNPRTSAQPQ